MINADNQIPEEFMEMYSTVHKILKEDASIQQVLAVMDSNGQIYTSALHHITEGSHEEEEFFINNLEKLDVLSKLVQIVCMWHDGALDIPSSYFRENLRRKNSDYKEISILLCGGDSNFVKRLGVISR